MIPFVLFFTPSGDLLVLGDSYSVLVVIKARICNEIKMMPMAQKFGTKPLVVATTTTNQKSNR